MQCHAAAVGMANEMDLAFQTIDQCERPRCLVVNGEGTLARPRTDPFAAEMLRREQHISLSERLLERTPLVCVGP